ncbi:YihY/virulence factor BrkB family protein [Donghicola sp. XS_ASV15]|uniref:YihY/virulence factor BrkB family protein n=1 Tax=Donghicola sp. XS_ASV15 TaxID=3241295 RepID=UPI003511C8FE
MTHHSDRGRHAQSPTAIPRRGWKDIAFRLKDKLAEDRIGLISAGVAFYALLAIFPAMTALIAIGGIVMDPARIVEQLTAATALLPTDVSDIIVNQATEVAGSTDGGLGLAAALSVALAIYSTSKGVASLMQGLNVAYDESEKRGLVMLKLQTLALTAVLVLGLLVGLGATLALPTLMALFQLDLLAEIIVSAGSMVILMGMALLGLAVIYRFGPSRRNARWLWVSPGALVAGVGWIVASAGFAIYVGNFAAYNESFGALAGVIVMLTWLWMSAFIILLGAEINGEIEAQTRIDTTVGAPRPMGQRGATKADVLGETAG